MGNAIAKSKTKTKTCMPCAVAIIVKSTDESQITIQQEMHASIVEYIKNSFMYK